MNMRLRWGLTFLVAMVLLGGAAWAQSTVDVRPTAVAVIDWIGGAATIVGGVVAGFLVRFLNSRAALLNAQQEAALVDQLRGIIGRGIQYAMTLAKSEVSKEGSGLARITVDNWFIKVAADYAQEAAPGILKRFYPDPEKMRRKLEDMVIATIPDYFPVGVTANTTPAVAGGLTATPIAAAATQAVGKPSSAAGDASVTVG
jgi:hypothetical protein